MPAKLTAAEMVKRISGQSMGRLWWEQQKKLAAPLVDVKVFNKGLGPAIDSYRQLVKGAVEVQRIHPKLDDRTLKPVRNQRDKLDKIIAEYSKVCRAGQNAASQTPTQKRVWSKLEKDVLAMGMDLDRWYDGLT